MSDDRAPALPDLLTPKQVALWLLEDAQLRGFRSNGAEGIVPVTVDGHVCYQLRDVQRFIERTQAAA